MLASGGADGVKLWTGIKSWENNPPQEVATLEGKGPVAFSPDGELLASQAGGNQGDAIKLWLVANGEEISTLKGHRGKVTAIAFSPDGQLLASGSRDSTIKLWEVQRVKSR